MIAHQGSCPLNIIKCQKGCELEMTNEKMNDHDCKELLRKVKDKITQDLFDIKFKFKLDLSPKCKIGHSMIKLRGVCPTYKPKDDINCDTCGSTTVKK